MNTRRASVVLLLAAAAFAGPAAAAPQFDGRWAVEIIPQSGTCDGRYVIPVEVVRNNVIYIGRGQMQASGGIAANGTVRVSFHGQGDRLDARGRLTSDSFGQGSWRSPTEDCAGRWVARKG
jgi:hypothetical protein